MFTFSFQVPASVQFLFTNKNPQNYREENNIDWYLIAGEEKTVSNKFYLLYELGYIVHLVGDDDPTGVDLAMLRHFSPGELRDPRRDTGTVWEMDSGRFDYCCCRHRIRHCGGK